MKQLNEIKRDIATAIGILLFALMLYLQTTKIQAIVKTQEVGPRFVPYLIAGCLAILSIILLLSSLVKFKKVKETLSYTERNVAIKNEKLNWNQFVEKYGHIITWIVMLVCTLLIRQIGFIISGIIIMFVCTYMMAPKSQRNLKVFIPLSICVPIIIYYIFVKVLYLMLPAGFILQRIGIA